MPRKNGENKPVAEAESPRKVDRRGFLGSLGAAAATGALVGPLSGCTGGGVQAALGVDDATARALASQSVRNQAAQLAFERGTVTHVNNGDEALYPNFIGNFSKGLPHNALGEVDQASYQTFIQALDTRDFALLDTLTIGPRKLENPQGGIVFPLVGVDPQSITMPPAPAFASAEEAGEMVELYWMALLRDVHFSDYATDGGVANAVADLNAMSDFRGPKVSGMVTPGTLFRSPTPGDLAGPYVSQLLLKDFNLGTLPVPQRQRTYVPGVDYMSGFSEWLAIQTGAQPSVAQSFDGTARYIRNARDLASYVHDDVLFQAYFNAALVLLGMGVPFKPSVNAYAGSPSQVGFTSFGGPHLLGVLTEVANYALRAVWFQKWFVHRRLRPEAFAGRVEVHTTNQATYPLHADVLNSAAVAQVQSGTGTALLPMAYTEGSPRHPAYGAGHAIIAGACVTVLKAFFDEDFIIPNPVVASADGLSLVPYTGPDAGSLTVGDELNKLAANIAQGRNMAGVHWRSDYTGSIPHGEAVTEAVLQEQKLCFNEMGTFTFTRFDGTTAVI
ncbi:MAG: vanadium-dependent haloperoxidase [Planctomycetota bacterium]